MDSLDNLRERFAALEQRTEHLHQQTRTVAQRLRWWRGMACGLMLVGLVSLPLPPGMAKEEHPEKDNKGLAQRVRQLEAQVTALQATLAAVTFDATTKELVITEANLRIVNGLGRTDCGPEEEPIPNCPNGLGNLIVGYNELREVENIRTGSHNVVVGREHNFSRFGGVVVGSHNTITGDFSSVSGGFGNRASGIASSVSGGQLNTASGIGSSVSGGFGNRASGEQAAVSGGNNNAASGFSSSVSGGQSNRASGGLAAVSGGQDNEASRGASSVSGGESNAASATFASVSGGAQNTATGVWSSVSGGDNNTASGFSSSVSGGRNNTASGTASSVSGGANRTAPAALDWAAGSLFEDD